MSISTVTSQSLIASLGCLDPTQTQSADQSSADPLAASQSADSSAQTTGSTVNGISQVGYILSSLAKLQKQDPAGFKQNAAATAKDFRDAATQCGDMLQRLSLESMAGQFSNASLTGSMASINLASTSTTLVRAYAGQSSLSLLDNLGGGTLGTDLSSQVSSILNGNMQQFSGGTSG